MQCSCSPLVSFDRKAYSSTGEEPVLMSMEGKNSNAEMVSNGHYRIDLTPWDACAEHAYLGSLNAGQ